MTFTWNLFRAQFDLARLATRGHGLVSLWQERARGRRDLHRLDAHFLADIGLSPYDAAHEAAKPFWRA